MRDIIRDKPKAGAPPTFGRRMGPPHERIRLYQVFNPKTPQNHYKTQYFVGCIAILSFLCFLSIL